MCLNCAKTVPRMCQDCASKFSYSPILFIHQWTNFVPKHHVTLVYTSSVHKANSRDLIGLAAMVYEPLYHALEKPLHCLKLSSGCSCNVKSARYSNFNIHCNNYYSTDTFGYDLIIYHLISNTLMEYLLNRPYNDVIKCSNSTDGLCFHCQVLNTLSESHIMVYKSQYRP